MSRTKPHLDHPVLVHVTDAELMAAAAHEPERVAPVRGGLAAECHEMWWEYPLHEQGLGMGEWSEDGRRLRGGPQDLEAAVEELLALAEAVLAYIACPPAKATKELSLELEYGGLEEEASPCFVWAQPAARRGVNLLVQHFGRNPGSIDVDVRGVVLPKGLVGTVWCSPKGRSRGCFGLEARVCCLETRDGRVDVVGRPANHHGCYD